MSHIHIKKGLDIRLKGKAQRLYRSLDQAPMLYALCPDDFHGIIPKLRVKEGETVQCGTPIFSSKDNPEIVFTSPVSGEVISIVRGAKRKILRVVIESDGRNEPKTFDTLNYQEADREAIVQTLLESGCWPSIKQRPYDIIALTTGQPRDIFVSVHNSAPLGADYEFVFEDEKLRTYFQAGIDVLAKLTEGGVHVSHAKDSFASKLENATTHSVSGLHPAGYVGTQIAHVAPINKGEVVWTVAAQDVAIIGRLFQTGQYNPTVSVAISGTEIESPSYVSIRKGANVSFLKDMLKQSEVPQRIISGGVLTGNAISEEDFLRFYDDQIVAILEGKTHEFFGWMLPNNKKFSISRANFFSWLTPKKEYALTTCNNGEERAQVITGTYEKVMPMDILPAVLLKAIMYEDIEEMENLGIYEVAPEDFALAEFVCPSKTAFQQIVREGLDLMIKEVGR